MDDKYFKQFEGNTPEDKNQQKPVMNENNNKKNTIPPKINPSINRVVKPPAFRNIKMPKPPVIHDNKITSRTLI